MTPVRAAIFTVAVSALAYAVLVYVIHWGVNIFYWGAMTALVGFLNVRKALLERRRD
jgi:hypothetical protein